MKKLLLLFVIVFSLPNVFAQEAESAFPYGKMLKMTHDELIEANFKYDKNKNRYVLTKQNGLNAASSILGALNGTPTNYVPHVNDYNVVVQRSENGVSSIQVTFYDSNVYDQVYDFATTCGENLKTRGAGSQAFTYQDYAFEISVRNVGQSASSTNRGVAATKDQSYSIYNFIIMTGDEPFSSWHTKQAEKDRKRDAQGKKKTSAADLM